MITAAFVPKLLTIALPLFGAAVGRHVSVSAASFIHGIPQPPSAWRPLLFYPLLAVFIVAGLLLFFVLLGVLLDRFSVEDNSNS